MEEPTSSSSCSSSRRPARRQRLSSAPHTGPNLDLGLKVCLLLDLPICLNVCFPAVGVGEQPAGGATHQQQGSRMTTAGALGEDLAQNPCLPAPGAGNQAAGGEIRQQGKAGSRQSSPARTRAPGLACLSLAAVQKDAHAFMGSIWSLVTYPELQERGMIVGAVMRAAQGQGRGI